ncbi:MAG: diaminopimelate decarboxylase [Deltaproteobacteria bacterium]|nr:diaminopimelate decarboxylase [Deltaproteobacteria bacterium]
MHHFQYRDGQLQAEEVPLAAIAAEVGTPVYVYSRATLLRHFHAFDGAFKGLDHLVCFSVKVNSNLAVLKLFGDLGAGADVVSGGELFRALEAGIPAERICFAGVGKTEAELIQGIEAGILMFNVESVPELESLNQAAGRLGRRAPVAIRVNPDVDAGTHPYISTGLKKNKFGLDVDQSLIAYQMAHQMDNIEVKGIGFHIGSQVTECSPFVDALARLKVLIGRLAKEGIELKYLDMGGGLGIPYLDEEPPQPQEYAAALASELEGLGLKVILEPGRVIAGNAGILLTRVVYIKETETKKFVIVDAAMNDLIRPSLYGAKHDIIPVMAAGPPAGSVDIVGPICESTDFLAQDRPMPHLSAGQLVAVMSAGAYGFVMASNYNSRPRPAEVMVAKDEYAVIKQRETYQDLIRGESLPGFLRGNE